MSWASDKARELADKGWRGIPLAERAIRETLEKAREIADAHALRAVCSEAERISDAIRKLGE